MSNVEGELGGHSTHSWWLLACASHLPPASILIWCNIPVGALLQKQATTVSVNIAKKCLRP